MFARTPEHVGAGTAETFPTALPLAVGRWWFVVPVVECRECFPTPNLIRFD